MAAQIKRQLNDGTKIRKEKEIVEKMIRVYCMKKHLKKSYARNVRA